MLRSSLLNRMRLVSVKIDAAVTKRLLSRRRKVQSGEQELFTMRNYGYSARMRSDTFERKEPEMLEWVKTWAAGSHFLDVGASTGVYSLYAAAQGHQVIALEPYALNFALLNLNISDNSFQDSITVFPCSANSQLAIANLNIAELEWGGGGSTFEREQDWTGKSFAPDFRQGSIGLSIDWLCQQCETYPNFIKVDVDGNELMVLRGAQETLKRPDCLGVYIELWQEHEEFDEACRILSDCGFVLGFVGGSDMFSQQKQYSRNYIFTKKL